jgi:regulatory protein
MRIKSLTAAPDRAGRHRVVFDDESVMRLYRQTVEDFGLYAGMDLDDTHLAQLKTAAGEMSAKMRAVRIVAAASVSKGDLERRLVQKGENPVQAKAAVAWMSEMSLVDDRATAEQVVARCIAKGYGLARAKQALYEKRIPKQYWNDALQDYPDQHDAIEAFLRSRLKDNWDQKDLRRAIDALLRKGHSYGNIKKVLEDLGHDNEFLEEG